MGATVSRTSQQLTEQDRNMATFRFTVTVRSIVRAPSSGFGNPRYRILTDSGEFKTEVDGSIGYSLPNLTNRRFDTCIIDKEVTLLGTGRRDDTARNRIYAIEQ